MISVIVTTYNRESVLRLCLESLVCQTTSEFEVIVADDGSNDQTTETIKEYSEKLNLKYIWQSKRGWQLSKSRNNGIALSRSPAVVFIDADILLNPFAVQAYQDIFERNPDRAIGAYYRYLPPMEITVEDVRERWGKLYDGNLPRLNHPDWNPEDSTLKDMREVHLQMQLFEDEDKLWYTPFSLIGGNLMIPKHILDEVGWWDESFQCHGGEDAEISLRIAEKYPFSYSIRAAGAHVAHPRGFVKELVNYDLGAKIRGLHPHWFDEGGAPIWTKRGFRPFPGRASE